MKATRAIERFLAVNINASTDGVDTLGDTFIVVTTGQAIAAGANFNIQIRNPEINPMGNNQVNVLPTVRWGTNSQGTPIVARIQALAVGLCVLQLTNVHATLATNGTLELHITIVN